MGGGGFPTFFNEVDIYDPVSNTWSLGTPFVTARRNSANDTDGTNNIWLAGGIDENLGSLASTEIFNCPVSPCGSPYAYTDSNGNCNSDCNGNRDGHADPTPSRTSSYANAAASPDSSASPVA